MSATPERTLILGAGHAGGTLAAVLRMQGYAGSITLIGDEPYAPYQRPPLSKACLKGEAEVDSLALKPPAFYLDQKIDMRCSVTARSIDRSNKTVALSDGISLGYDHLILATGARPIKPSLPGSELAGVLVLRTVEDAERLRATLRPRATLVIVGGGYIGLEVAAAARALGVRVILIERESRLLARVAAPALSDFFEAYHRERGVEFRLGAEVRGFQGDESFQIAGVSLSTGEDIPCTAALLGVGAMPNDEIAVAAGLDCDRGVVVDLEGRTSHPDIFAIGDVTRRPLPLYDRMFRLESVPNALEQAKQAACAITGRPAPAAETPWFWSDQFDLKLQIAGLPFDADRVVVRGEPDQARFAVFHLRADEVQAVEAVNAPAEFMVGRQLITARKRVDAVKLADRAVPMKEVAI